MALQTGDHIGIYEITALLGAGGMATVYQAYHARLNRYVAIKVMHESFRQDPTFHARFEREAQIVAGLEHPNIVPVYDFSEHEGQPYLVMKWVEGRTLKRRMSEGLLSLDEIIEVMTPIADALTYAHKKGVLHRDIKPANIILGDDGTPYLTDFGLARMAQSGESTLSTDMMIGTPHYISPEQALGSRDLDGRTDVYSFGVVLYEQVCGRVPFTADTPYAIVHDHIYKPLPKPDSLNPEIPPQVALVLEKALAKDRAERYETPKAMMEDFRRAVKESGLRELREDRAQTAAANVNLGDLIKGAVVQPPKSPTAPAPTPRASSDSEKGKRFMVRVDEKEYDLNEIGEKVGQWFGQWGKDFGKRAEHWGKNFEYRAERWGRKIERRAKHAEARIGGVADPLIPLAENYTDDEATIRRTAQRRFWQRNLFFVHLLVFILVLSGLSNLWSGLNASVFAEIEGMGGQIARTMPVPLLVALGWGQGVLAHGLSVFFDTGARLQARRRRIEAAMERRYGANWRETSSPQEYRRVSRTVEQRVKLRVGFIQRGLAFVLSSIAFLIIWDVLQPAFMLISDPNALWVRDLLTGYTVPLAFTLLSGILLLLNGIGVMVGSMNAEARERLIEREIAYSQQLPGAKLKNEMTDKPKRDERLDVDDAEVRLTGDGEFTDSFVQQIEERAVKK